MNLDTFTADQLWTYALAVTNKFDTTKLIGRHTNTGLDDLLRTVNDTNTDDDEFYAATARFIAWVKAEDQPARDAEPSSRARALNELLCSARRARVVTGEELALCCRRVQHRVLALAFYDGGNPWEALADTTGVEDEDRAQWLDLAPDWNGTPGELTDAVIAACA